ncbi:hypothetical protein DFJ74DRAFT_695911 [Hyaloraphidium curvatum]|nr:hypothetical protein DFJ74DRAFT_695911 [Hyaloraphidium curvatum]
MSILEDRRVQAVIQTVAFVLFGLGVFLLNMLRLAFSGFRRSLWSKRGFFAEKQLGFSKRLPMREVKRVKNALGVSINDLMVTCTHSAVVKYARERDALKDSSLAYLVPTSLRARGDNAMNNQSSGWLLPLPVEGSEKSLLKVVRRRMNRFKKSLEPYLYFWGLNISGYFPWLVPLPSPGTALGRFVWPKFGKILSAITNVPGPSAQLFWAGVPYTQYVAVIPCATPNGLGLAIASYNEGISLGIQMDLDAGGVPGKDLYAKGDGFVIARLFEEAFEAMRKEADVAEARQAEAVKAEAK